MCSSSALTRRIHPLTTPSQHLPRGDTRSKRKVLSTLRQVGKNKPEVGSADRRGTRAGESLHERLTKNHGFLVQPTGASAIIGGRGEKSPCRAGQSRFHRRVLHAPCSSRQGDRERR